MKRRKFVIGLGATGAALAVTRLGNFTIPAKTAYAQTSSTMGMYDTSHLPYLLKRRVTHADRKLSASYKPKKSSYRSGLSGVNANGMTIQAATATVASPIPGGIPDYFGDTPNYALSPIIPKFVDSLPGLTSLKGVGPGFGANSIGNYLPIAAPDTTTYADSDYYEIGLVEYEGQFHSSLGKTKLRGYVQLNTVDKNNVPLTDLLGNPVTTTPHYLGPVILANRYFPEYPAGAVINDPLDPNNPLNGQTNGKPVRIKFVNKLPTGSGGNLFIPVDTTVMGAGSGYDNAGTTAGIYTQNRATLHLHGGNTPWISDGTAHQWTVPVGETSTTLTKGVSVQYVPDMPAAGLPPIGDGELTFYWTNQQSGRLMFYHDHAYGITRLNVYSGEAAGYLLQDPYISGMVKDGLIPAITDVVPLVIQDKTFIDPTTIAKLDPTWPFTTDATGQTLTVDATRNDLWFPHVYMPNQNPYDPSGANAMGRWDYGPWFWPPFTGLANKPIANPYYNAAVVGSSPEIPGFPLDATKTKQSPSIVPEGFMDTPIVNGQAYPYITVDPKAYRFLILNACNDRFLNLQLYKATGIVGSITLTTAGSGYQAAPTVTIDAPIAGGSAATAKAVVSFGVGAINVGFAGKSYPTAPTVTISDPSIPLTAGGVTATATATIDATGAVTGFNITNPGAGYTVAPFVTISANPNGATKSATATATLDTVTGGPVVSITLVSSGSGYTTLDNPQVKISAPQASGGVNAVATVTVYTNPTEVGMVPATPGSWPAGWPTPDGREGGFPDPANVGPSFIQFGTEGGLLPAPVTIQNRPIGYDYNRRSIVVLNVLEKALFMGSAERADTIIDFSQFAGQTLILYNDAPAPVPAFDPRNDYYTGAPDHSLAGDGTGGAPTTKPGFGPNTRTIMQIRVNNTTPAAAYATTKLPTFTTRLADAFAKSQDKIIVLNNKYSNAYGLNIPADAGVRIQDTKHSVYNNVVSAIPVSNGGSGYIDIPNIKISGGNGLGATAVANMNWTTAIGSFKLLSGGAGYTQPPTVGFSGGGGSGAAATAYLSPTSVKVQTYTVTNGGTGYTSAPTVGFTGGGGSGAVATATLSSGGSLSGITITNGGSGYNRAPTITVSAPPRGGTTATATATTARRVTTLNLTNGGTGYTSAPTINITGGGGTGATATAAVSGVVASIAVGNGGNNYNRTPTVTISGGGGTGATATATVTGRRITAITITNPGTGYTSAPIVGFTGGGGTGAAATATIANAVVSLTVTNGGTGYTGTPTVGFTGGGGTGAAATATVASAVATITLTNAGRGYTTTPTVTFNNGGTGGSGAAATAVMASGVASITVTSGGSGYTSVPTVTFTGGGGTGTVAPTVQLAPTSVAGINVTTGGSGYTSVPTVTFTRAVGTTTGGGAAAVAVWAHDRTVASVTITNGGGGFLSEPTVTFDPAPTGGVTATAVNNIAVIAQNNLTMNLEPKAIQELFETEYGRMNAILGSEIPNTTGVNQTTLPNAFIDPPNEIIKNPNFTQPIGSAEDGTQIWKITHNGVDTHAIHFHLMTVQLLNRVGWDGAMRPPEDNELGWKDTVRMNPLEDCIVALRPYAQTLPASWGGLPNSVRTLDPTQKVGGTMGFTGVDPNNLPAPVTNDKINFGWEYTWHCHLLGHEENDMMRPIIFGVAPDAPIATATAYPASPAPGRRVVVNWTSLAKNVTGFTVERSTSWDFATKTTVGTVGATTYTITDTTVTAGTTYFYRVIANNVVGYTKTYPAVGTTTVGYANTSFDSKPSASIAVSAL
ncbi:hypothetical protein [Candidatus Chlorohelix sp.]|uniref:hypothetical protein n=1 Tax=Candidatus Chlorohelix sp. TaxID=3139201 RepID=UPI0030358D39